MNLFLNLLAQSWITSNCLQVHWHGLHTLTPWSSLALISAPLLTRYFTVFIWPLSTSKCRRVIWWREMNYIRKQELADIQASYWENYKILNTSVLICSWRISKLTIQTPESRKRCHPKALRRLRLSTWLSTVNVFVQTAYNDDKYVYYWSIHTTKACLLVKHASIRSINPPCVLQLAMPCILAWPKKLWREVHLWRENEANIKSVEVLLKGNEYLSMRSMYDTFSLHVQHNVLSVTISAKR